MALSLKSSEKSGTTISALQKTTPKFLDEARQEGLAQHLQLEPLQASETEDTEGGRLYSTLLFPACLLARHRVADGVLLYLLRPCSAL